MRETRALAEQIFKALDNKFDDNADWNAVFSWNNAPCGTNSNVLVL